MYKRKDSSIFVGPLYVQGLVMNFLARKHVLKGAFEGANVS